ncbi:hypothetical protein [Rubritalea marina]|uniref:hypothetical protein n=1 Tax=Rubritalea marina TaxID=361055 RepID=UPI0003780AA5|nr:hypothetical protein [Rubritalea marina]
MKKTLKFTCMAAMLLAPIAVQAQGQGSSAANAASAVKAANGNNAAIVAAVKSAVKDDKANAAAIVGAAVKALGKNPSPALVANIVNVAAKQAGAGASQASLIGMSAKNAAGNSIPVVTAVNQVILALVTANPLDIAGGGNKGIGGNGVNNVVNQNNQSDGKKPRSTRD